MSFPKRSGVAATPPDAFELMLTRSKTSTAPHYLHDALAKAVADYKAVHDSVGRIAKDKTLTDAARLVRQATVARGKMISALASVEAAKQQATAGRKLNEAELSKPLDYRSSNLADISLAAEVRAYARGLPIADRSAFMLKAIEGIDLDTLRAIAAAPAFLSGLPQQLHDLARSKLLSVVAPEPLERVKILAADEKFAETLHDQLAQATADLVDFASADDIAKNADAA